jgi:DNA invertase Pin-like site-specific DNA recombinase
MRVLIAARLSKKTGNREGLGIETQDERSREWAEGNGHEVVGVAADTASGTVAPWHRKNLKPWVTDETLMSQYDAVVAYKMDRLSRAGWRDESEIRHWAEDNGKRLIIVDGPQWPPRDDGDRWAWEAMSIQARKEWESIRERTTRAQGAIRERGGLVGKPGYGYRVEGERYAKTLVVFEPEAEVVREATRRYLNGETVDALAADFNERGLPSPMINGEPGTKWLAKRLAVILRSPSIAGRRYDSTGRMVLEFEPIIDWPTHERLVARLDERASRKGISPGITAMLTGVLFDADGNKMYKISGYGGVRYYSREGKVGVDLAKMDARVDTWFSADERPHLVPQTVPGENHSDEIARLKQDLSELDVMADDYMERVAALRSQITELVREDEENPNPDRVELVDSGQTVGEVWRGMTTAQRRDMLKSRNIRVIWGSKDNTDEGWHLEWEMVPGEPPVKAWFTP